MGFPRTKPRVGSISTVPAYVPSANRDKNVPPARKENKSFWSSAIKEATCNNCQRLKVVK